MEVNEEMMKQMLAMLNAQQTKQNEEADWKAELLKDGKGKVLNDVTNYLLYLNKSDKYKGQIKYNDYMQQKEVFGQEFDDFIMNRIYNDFEREFGFCSHAKMDSALFEAFDTNRYNPVIDYLKSIEWDGIERCGNLFIDLLDADDTELNKAMTMKWFMAAVKRVIEPGCKFDNIIVLQGNQGIGKSSICELLSRGFFNTISLSEIGNKDLIDKLNKTWIAIIDELDTFNKKEMSTIKTFLSLNTDCARLAFERNTRTFKRHCVFIGSTNDETFLRDSTSSVERRFWVIKCNKEKMDGKIREVLTNEYVNQLWAEAYHKLNLDFNQYLDIDKSLQEDFANTMREFKTYTDDVVIDYIKEILDRKYYLDNKGEFEDAMDILNQYNKTKMYDNNGFINKIPMAALHWVLKSVYKEDRPSKYIALALSQEWEYKPISYKGKTHKGLYRKNQIEIEEKTENINELPF